MPLALVDHITLRHRYIFEFLFNDVLGLPVLLTDNRKEFRESFGLKFAYTTQPEEEQITFFPAGLLSERGIHAERPNVIDYEGLKMIFPVNDGADLPFDPFSMAFYILSRMEEYLPFQPDEHGRFTERNSIQAELNLLDEPIVNRLAFLIFEKLKTRFPQLQAETTFTFLPTIDVDIAFAHLGKQPLRAAGGFLKLLLKGDFCSLQERVKTLRGKLRDPYDNFDLHQELADEYDTGLIYFFLLGDYGKYDKMLSFKNEHFRKLIRELSQKAGIGIHPSYASFSHPEKLRQEVSRLENITNEKVTRHRAHFLRLRFPDTFRELISQGITDDYSLGYSAMNGFRAGTSTPFYFYDLLKEEITSLTMHPFIFMDSAMIDHLQLSPGEAQREASGLIDKTRKWGGEAIGIWHNYSLCERDQYRGWQQFFRNIMESGSK